MLTLGLRMRVVVVARAVGMCCICLLIIGGVLAFVFLVLIG